MNKIKQLPKNVLISRGLVVNSLKQLSLILIGFSVVACNNGEPVANGPILTASNVPLIDTVYESSGTITVINAGNAQADLTTVYSPDNSGISNLNGCSGQTLMPAESCVIRFNVPESGGTSNINIPYTGVNTDTSLSTSVSWYNSRGNFALTAMSASVNPLEFEVFANATSIITITNIGGYTLSDIVISTPIVISGSAVATIGANTCNGPLAINDSCTYTVNISDGIVEQDQSVNLGFSAKYAGPRGETVYNRSLLLSYTSAPL